jgi:hypothetical protein
MDECIVEMLKLLIWLEDTCKQKKKSEWDGKGKSGEGEGEEADLLPPSLVSVF